jgi:hypothetical protein
LNLTGVAVVSSSGLKASRTRAEHAMELQRDKKPNKESKKPKAPKKPKKPKEPKA